MRLIVVISIHAPPRGATTASAGRTTGKVFQFTPLREGRPQQIKRITIFQHYFNSRPSARGDKHVHRNSPSTLYFNSRPSARGDCSFVRMMHFATLFQFTPLREGRHSPTGMSCRPAQNFNSRPSARGDRLQVAETRAKVNFNSRPSARGDANEPSAGRVRQDFNSRPSARGDWRA